jgi:hypothetical protein
MRHRCGYMLRHRTSHAAAMRSSKRNAAPRPLHGGKMCLSKSRVTDADRAWTSRERIAGTLSRRHSVLAGATSLVAAATAGMLEGPTPRSFCSIQRQPRFRGVKVAAVVCRRETRMIDRGRSRTLPRPMAAGEASATLRCGRARPAG